MTTAIRVHCDYCDLCVGTHTKDTDIDEIYIKIGPKVSVVLLCRNLRDPAGGEVKKFLSLYI